MLLWHAWLLKLANKIIQSSSHLRVTFGLNDGIQIRAISDFIQRTVLTIYCISIILYIPAIRMSPSRPFSNTEIDYACPFIYKVRNKRNIKSFKNCIAFIICFSTHITHLELASELSIWTLWLLWKDLLSIESSQLS